MHGRMKKVVIMRELVHGYCIESGVSLTCKKTLACIYTYTLPACKCLCYAPIIMATNSQPFIKTMTMQSDSDCAIIYIGGWWYNACYYSNLNGKSVGGLHNFC